ncbi:MAG: hypothetical protein FWE38_00395 [Firmicutes bacterium]|nr:hypothetical protein [Bacillota bacterium]
MEPKEKPQTKYRPSVDFGKEISLRQQFVTLVAMDEELSKTQKDRIIELGLRTLMAEEVEVCD